MSWVVSIIIEENSASWISFTISSWTFCAMIEIISFRISGLQYFVLLLLVMNLCHTESHRPRSSITDKKFPLFISLILLFLLLSLTICTEIRLTGCKCQDNANNSCQYLWTKDDFIFIFGGNFLIDCKILLPHIVRYTSCHVRTGMLVFSDVSDSPCQSLLPVVQDKLWHWFPLTKKSTGLTTDTIHFWGVTQPCAWYLCTFLWYSVVILIGKTPPFVSLWYRPSNLHGPCLKIHFYFSPVTGVTCQF